VPLVAVLLIGGGLVAAALQLFGEGGAGGVHASEEEQIRTFCGTCHRFPEPGILPRALWKSEVEKMYEMAGAREDIVGIPPIERTLRFFDTRAPVTLPPPPTYVGTPPGPVAFSVHGFPSPDPQPCISFVSYVSFLDATRRDLLVSDMFSGRVMVQPPDQPRIVLAQLAHPALTQVVDLDGDGVRDILVAELGSFYPEDHDRGKVIWLRGRGDGTVEPIPLLEKVGRVADVRAADLDGDGDLDLAVAVFGWRVTGKVLVMFNTGKVDERGVPRFRDEMLDERTGAINVPIVDLDGDGHLDIVVLLSQQHETVVAYLADGEGWYRRVPLYEAPHPDWGSSGIEMADLDGDGDLDVIMVCGDTLDTAIVNRPDQGVWWLENRGTYPFTPHKLASLVGVHKARAADLDGDGDLDIAASSFIPQLREEGNPDFGKLDSVLWIEQTARGEFAPHLLEHGRCDHPALEVGDFDGDGRTDIVVGNFYSLPVAQPVDWLTFFVNRGPR